MDVGIGGIGDRPASPFLEMPGGVPEPPSPAGADGQTDRENAYDLDF